MATKKKAVINYRKVAQDFAIEVDDVLFSLYEVKDMAFIGDITNKDLVHELFTLCHKLENAMAKYEESTDED
jgi:hypothetical protein